MTTPTLIVKYGAAALSVIILILLILCGLFRWWVGPFTEHKTYPNEKRLADIFHLKRNIFEQLKLMAYDDKSHGFRVGKTNLDSIGIPKDRLHEYRRLLSMIDPNVVLLANNNIVYGGKITNDYIFNFNFKSGGSDSPIGPQWSYGIEYVSSESVKYGTIVKSFKWVNLNKRAILILYLSSLIG